MPLTAAQRDWEVNWTRRLIETTRTGTVEEWLKFYKDDALCTRPGILEVKGTDAIKQVLSGVRSMVHSLSYDDTSITIDEDNGKIIYITSIVATLVADPEKQEIPGRAVVIVKKALGVQEEQMDHEEVVTDASASYKRLADLGIDVMAGLGQK